MQLCVYLLVYSPTGSCLSCSTVVHDPNTPYFERTFPIWTPSELHMREVNAMHASIMGIQVRTSISHVRALRTSSSKVSNHVRGGMGKYGEAHEVPTYLVVWGNLHVSHNGRASLDRASKVYARTTRVYGILFRAENT